MEERGRLTVEDVMAVRRWIETGEPPPMDWTWLDEAVARARSQGLPELERIQKELEAPPSRVRRQWSAEREQVHQAVVALIHDFMEEDGASTLEARHDGEQVT